MKYRVKVFSCILLFIMMVSCGCNGASETEQVQSPPPEEEQTAFPEQETDSGEDLAETTEASEAPSVQPGSEGSDSSGQDAQTELLEQKKESFYAAQQEASEHFLSVKKSVKGISLTEEQEEDYRYFEPIAVYYEELASEQLSGCTEEEIECAIQGLEEFEASLTSFEKTVAKE